jgi:hypothetical protein
MARTIGRWLSEVRDSNGLYGGNGGHGNGEARDHIVNAIHAAARDGDHDAARKLIDHLEESDGEDMPEDAEPEGEGAYRANDTASGKGREALPSPSLESRERARRVAAMYGRHGSGPTYVKPLQESRRPRQHTSNRELSHFVSRLLRD